MNLIDKNQRNYGLGLAGAVTALLTFFALTNPLAVPVGLLAVPVVLFFIAVFCGLHIIFSWLHILAGKPRKRRLANFLGAGLITVVLILHSTGGISGADMILLALILLISAIYVDRF